MFIGIWHLFYGSFATVIIFIIWTSLNWIAVLYGEEFLCVWQNKLYHENVRFGKVFLFDLGYVLLILKEVYTDFINNGEGLTALKIAKKFKFNSDDVKNILFTLENERIVASENDLNKIFYLRKNIAKIKLSDVEELIWKKLFHNEFQKSDEIKKICLDLGRNYIKDKDSSKTILIQFLKSE
jgi:hypothetical protein